MNASFFRKPRILFFIVAVTLLALGGIVYTVVAARAPRSLQRSTTGDVEVIHSQVLVAGTEQKGIGRVAPGDHIVTGESGRARLNLVEGVTVLLDESTDASLEVGGLVLHQGRLFVDSPEGRNLTIKTGELTARLAASKTAIEHSTKAQKLSLYCAQGEVMVSVKGQSQRVQSGETLRVLNGKLTVEPEKAFDDWTQGLAVPWQTQRLSRSGLPEVWVYSNEGEPESELHVKSEAIQVTLDGELAITRAKTTYFNGNEQTVQPKLRVALPPKAQLFSASYRELPATRLEMANLELCAPQLSGSVDFPGLEWGGNGWLAGKLPAVSPGATIELTLEYSEWLNAEAGRMTYRHPFAKGVGAPQIGELSVHVDASLAHSSVLESNRGATRKGDELVWLAADIRPSDDWVTSYVPAVLKPKEARAYIEASSTKGDPFVMVRLEAPPRPPAPVRLALVLDTSASVGISGLELGRNLVEALIGNLSAKDHAIVVVADEESYALLGDKPQALTSEWRKRLSLELAKLRPGGASDLGHALEFAADKLEESAEGGRFQNAVVYLGDGKPTLGALGADKIRGRLMRRTGGMPKLSAVALGRAADEWQLAKLVSGAGEIHAVTERAEAAVVASKLIAALEQPSYSDLRVDFGPELDRSYPREGQSVRASSTFTAYARLRGTLPNSVTVSYFEEGKQKNQVYALRKVASPKGADVARRWAEQRIFELVASPDGLQPARLLAKEHRLLTPWSSYRFAESTGNDQIPCTAFERRLIELSSLNDTPYAARIAPVKSVGAGWLEPPKVYDQGQSLEDAIRMHVRATIDKARSAIVGCYNSRYGAKQALPSKLDYSLRLSGAGKVETVQVSAASGEPADLPFQRCAERVILAQTYLGAERPVTVTGQLQLPPAPRTKRSSCSIASRLPLELRRGIWQSRAGSAFNVYLNALNSCELPTWLERRQLLDVLLDREKSFRERIAFLQELRASGFSDAVSHVERGTIERLTELDELEQVRKLMLQQEPNIDALLITQLKQATTTEARLSVVQAGLRLAPHSPLGRRLLLLLLEDLGRTPELRSLTDNIRQDPFADAGLLTRAAAALRRLGEERASRRAFAELFERAPYDPWILAFAGDNLRHAALYDEAILAYESLNERHPDDTANLLRLGLSQGAAGRVDIATRLLDRASQIGGRADGERLHELSAYVKAVILAEARDKSQVVTEREELSRRLAATAMPEVEGVVLIEVGERTEEAINVEVYRNKTKTAEAPELQTAPLGLYGLALEPGVTELRIVLTRKLTAGLGRPLPVKVHLLRLGSELLNRKLTTKVVEFAKHAERAELTLTEELRP